MIRIDLLIDLVGLDEEINGYRPEQEQEDNTGNDLTVFLLLQLLRFLQQLLWLL